MTLKQALIKQTADDIIDTLQLDQELFYGICEVININMGWCVNEVEDDFNEEYDCEEDEWHQLNMA